jgi:hypothetical protein
LKNIVECFYGVIGAEFGGKPQIAVIIDEEVMKEIDRTWKCSPEEVDKKGGPIVSFCGICIEEIDKGFFIHQGPYIRDLLKKHRLEACTATKILLDKETEDADKGEEDDEEAERWKASPEFLSKVREAQRIAGEVLWVTTRTRPDLCYPIQRMTSLATKDPIKALKYGSRMLRYLKGTEHFGLKYLDQESTKKKYEEYKEDWPEETFEEERVCVWTDSSYASQSNSKSQGALVVTHTGSPVFWKCGTQALIATSTAESELQMMVEGGLAAQNIGMLIKEVLKPNKIKEVQKESIEEFQKREEFAIEEPRDENEKEDVLCIDNKAATQILIQESGSWRTRHLRVRASSLKQRVEEKRLKLTHVPGRSMLADLNTKSHPFARLSLLRKLWGIEEIDEKQEEEPDELMKIRVKMLNVNEPRGSTDHPPPPNDEEPEAEKEKTPEDT